MTASSTTGIGPGSAENALKQQSASETNYTLLGKASSGTEEALGRVKKVDAPGYILVEEKTTGSVAPVRSVFTRIGEIVAEDNDYTALQIDYDNTSSGLTSMTVQDAVDEIAANPSSAKGIFLFGATSVASSTAVRYLFPGFSNSNAVSQDLRVEVSKSGTLKNMYVVHVQPAGNGNLIDYTLTKNGASTSLVASVPSTAANGSNIVDTVDIVPGDQIGLSVLKSSGIGSSPNQVYVTIEMA